MAKKKRGSPPAAAPEDGDPGDKAGKEKAKPSWRSGLDFIVMLGGAVLVALLIKMTVFDVYLIPSGSMETALHGRPDGGDRIFCSKLNYRFRSPKRWEVAVFEFPYESARRTSNAIASAELEQYRNQNFVKRIVGLPDETLAIGRGDIWVRPAGGGGDYRREIKPDSVQRGMWLNVYEEDFSDLDRRELETFWKVLGGEASLARGGPLRLAPAAGGEVRLDYRPLVPAGVAGRSMVELAGVPDRYTVRQPVQFRCRNVLEDGRVCGHVYVKTTWTQNMQARCPVCGSLQDESAAIFYHRRSGLAVDGRYAVNPDDAPQGEVSDRYTDYHFVPDLRVVADVVLAAAGSRFAITLREDSRFVQAVVTGDGRVEIMQNGQTAPAQQRALAAIRPGAKHRVEFYIVDGTARLFVDSEEKPLLDLPVWNDRRPLARNLVKSSGVSLTAAGGDCTVERLVVDRDVFYYSSWERERGIKFGGMNPQGEVFINSESFLPMGDNCPSSFDARSWGPVPLTLLRGPALFVWWPPDRIGTIASP